MARHGYFQEHDGEHETKFRKAFEKVVKEFESSKTAKLILKKVVPDYVESLEGVAFAFKVL